MKYCIILSLATLFISQGSKKIGLEKIWMKIRPGKGLFLRSLVYYPAEACFVPNLKPNDIECDRGLLKLNLT